MGSPLIKRLDALYQRAPDGNESAGGSCSVCIHCSMEFYEE